MTKRIILKAAIWTFLGIVLLASAVLLGIYLARHTGLLPPVQQTQEIVEEETPARDSLIPVPDLEAPDFEPAAETAPSPAIRITPPPGEGVETAIPDSSEEPAPSEAPYVSPVDFTTIWAVNPDVVAWLYIPGIELSFPVMMDPEDNSYYLTHDPERNVTDSGAIFIENYNSPAFTDLCTIIYGHRMYDESMFGSLQATYSDRDSLEANKYIVIYRPEREIYYEIFAAVPYDNSHILYYNDFDDSLSYRKFINSIYTISGMDAIHINQSKPDIGDRLLILSTCLWGDRDRRYLVLAKELTVE